MVPLMPPDLRAQDPSLIIVEPYKELPVSRSGFVGPVPAIVGMEPYDNFVAYTDRKLYIHNAGHAMLAYLGHRKGLEYGYQAMDDPDIYPVFSQALDESGRALIARHGLDPLALEKHIEDLKRRFRNRALGDTIYRLGRDPIRKLGPTDRLLGASNLALEQGIEPDALAWGIAAALTFDDPRDQVALDLQALLDEKGLHHVLTEVCGLEPDGHLAQMVRDRYQKVVAGEWPSFS
jgi:mannitol-1-phosphate 5-dehydrogenase